MAAASVAVASVLTAGCGGGTAVVASSAGSPGLGTAAPVPGSAGTDPTVGPLFPTRTGSVHTCTASVVDSPGRDLLLTAAHCVQGTGAGMSFEPGAIDGRAPYGRWTVSAAYASPAWIVGHDPAADVAVLVVAPQLVGGRTVEVQERTGGRPLGSEPPVGSTVTVTGYPFGSAGRPVTCRSRVAMTAGFPAFDCPGFVDGTSGGPWVASTGRHAVVGLIGGRHQGGCRPAVSYSAPFTGTVRQVYEAAVAGGPPSTLPPPGPSGC